MGIELSPLMEGGLGWQKAGERIRRVFMDQLRTVSMVRLRSSETVLAFELPKPVNYRLASVASS
jgi:hypothetical protein